jgi:hypothetical protein
VRPLGPGDEIAGYRIEALAGRGGMGWCTARVSDDRTVAIKVIAPELAANPSFRARFEQESPTELAVPTPPPASGDATDVEAPTPVLEQPVARQDDASTTTSAVRNGQAAAPPVRPGPRRHRPQRRHHRAGVGVLSPPASPCSFC